VTSSSRTLPPGWTTAAADEHGIAMVLTGERQFRH
jgi:hypothetical protein